MGETGILDDGEVLLLAEDEGDDTLDIANGLKYQKKTHVKYNFHNYNYRCKQ